MTHSKYKKDVLIKNHTCVWGYYWKDRKWGYKCCHALLKQSYCTGEAGKAAEVTIQYGDKTGNETAGIKKFSSENALSAKKKRKRQKSLLQIHSDMKRPKEKKDSRGHMYRGSTDRIDEVKKKRLKETLKAKAEFLKGEALLSDTIRRNISLNVVPSLTEEETDAFHMKGNQYLMTSFLL